LTIQPIWLVKVYETKQPDPSVLAAATTGGEGIHFLPSFLHPVQYKEIQHQHQHHHQQNSGPLIKSSLLLLHQKWRNKTHHGPACMHEDYQ
jgi:hypothetical protein